MKKKKTVSHGNWNSSTGLDRLASKYQGPFCFHFPCTRVNRHMELLKALDMSASNPNSGLCADGTSMLAAKSGSTVS